MKLTQFVILGIAGAAALGAGMIALNLSDQPEVVPEVVEQREIINTEEVLIARDMIPIGTSLRSVMFEWSQWPKEALGTDYILRSQNPDGLDFDEKPSIARVALLKGEPVRKSKIVESNQGYMSAILPSGKRAVSISISTETGAGGFILPNDYVDVIMTRRDEGNSEGDYITETILENVRVLAIDQNIGEESDQSSLFGETATLQLSPDEARILTVAQQMADRLVLVLRPLKDQGDKTTKSAEYLLSGQRGKGRIRVIKYGNAKDVLTGPKNAE